MLSLAYPTLYECVGFITLMSEFARAIQAKNDIDARQIPVVAQLAEILGIPSPYEPGNGHEARIRSVPQFVLMQLPEGVVRATR